MDINNTNKWQSFCERLLKKTKDGSITWDDWSHKIRRDDSTSSLFVAHYEDWYILLYQFEYRSYHEDDEFHMSEDVAMELIDDEGMTQWTIPKVPGRSSLFDFVQYENANVGKLLDQILQD